MPSDIRSFFGGPGAGAVKPAATPSKPTPKSTKTASKGRTRKIVSDDDEDESEVKAADTKSKKATPVKSKKPAKGMEEEEETTSSAYFADTKSKQSKPVTNGSITTPKKNPTRPNATTPTSARRSARKNTAKSYAEDDDEEDDLVGKVDEGKDGGDDDIHADDFKTGRGADDYEEASSDHDDALPVSKRRAVNGKKHAPRDDDSDLDVEIPLHDGGADPKPKRAAARKRKAQNDDDADDSDAETTPKKKARKATSAPARKSKANKDDEPESKEVRDLMASIPTVRAPTPPPRDESRKFNFQPNGGNANVEPAAKGSKEIPQGAENCLAGMSFVFTGVLETLGREEGQNLVKRYGGKVVGAPSSKTSFVVLGSEAGPKKLETIRKLGIKTIDEDGLFEILRRFPANGGDSKAAAKHAEKKAAEEEKMKAEAIEMEKKDKARQKDAEKAAAKAAQARGLQSSKPKGPRPEDRLWVDKYAPDSMGSVCGNKGLVEKLQNWLRAWPKRHKMDFKQAGPDGLGIYRAAMLHGPPGIGKTTAAHLVAKLEGYDVVESNASDTRSKKLVETGLKGVLDTTSLLGFFAGDGQKVDASKRKLLLIMDEVDGMSAGDRGGVGALAAIAKKTNIPMILICNDRKLPKMKPFDFVTADFPFRRPTADMIRSRIMTICFREGMKLPTNVIDAIIEGSHADIRQIINMVSTIKLDSKEMDFSDGKAMSKAWEKHVILKPWDIVNKILRAEMFSQSSTATLNDKIELYFNDHEFSYLMLQENYLKTKMAKATNTPPNKHNLKLLELADSAAESISDGDLVDRMIHGSQQQWSLMPTHAVFSFVRPASFVNGNFSNQVGFTAWLGNNSKQGKLSRYVKEIQGHMRLRTSADRHEIRQQYLPALWNKTVKVLQTDGKDKVQEVIDFMDSYYLTRDDFEAMQELGLGPMSQDLVKLETQTKSSFTRLYNAQSHPMPFIKASAVGNAAAKMTGGKRDKPDLEEAVDESEDELAADGVLDADAEGESEEELDLKKDKYVKIPKKKAAPKSKAGAASKSKANGKRTRDEASEDDPTEDDGTPKKKRGGAAGRGRGRGRGKG